MLPDTHQKPSTATSKKSLIVTTYKVSQSNTQAIFSTSKVWFANWIKTWKRCGHCSQILQSIWKSAEEQSPELDYVNPI